LKVNLAGSRLPSHLETACFRIAQEALTNVVRHARARQAWIEVQGEGPDVELLIRDDGVGFDTKGVQEKVSRGEGFGLSGIQDRVRLVGGQIAIESEPGLGTSIRVRLPVELNPAAEGQAIAAGGGEAVD
jgi:signal transduction histidine kinase